MQDSIQVFFQEWAAGRRGLPELPNDAQFVYRIAKVSKILGKRLDETCSRHGLTRSQFEAMAVLRRRFPESLSAGELMEASLLTSGSVTAMINQLIARGLVVRAPDPTDKRRIEVQLTSQGVKTIEAAVAERIKDNGRIAELVPQGDRDEINRLMRFFLVALEKEEVSEHDPGTS